MGTEIVEKILPGLPVIVGREVVILAAIALLSALPQPTLKVGLTYFLGRPMLARILHERRRQFLLNLL